jgi:arylsulfatase A-like enzyme
VTTQTFFQHSAPETLSAPLSCGTGRSRLLAACLLAVAVGAALAARAPAPAAGALDSPNVVVVMTDDQTVSQTKVMKLTQRRLRDRGVSFTRSFASYPLCCPSRATFLTGQHSHNHGVLGNGTPIGGFDALDEPDTLGVWLQSAGFHTIHVGKFLNGYGRADPTYVPPGWDDWIAAPDTTTNRYFNYSLNENGSIVRYGGAAGDYKSDVYAGKAVEAIRGRAALGPAAEPFFLFVGFTAPHLPANPAPRHASRFRGKGIPRPPSFNEANVSDKPRFIRRLKRLSGRRVRRITANHRNQLRSLLSVDQAVARIVGELQATGLLSETYVIFTSDNGFFTGEHRIPKGKYLPHEPSLRVPLMIRGPGLAAGRRSEELVSNVDLAPTILEIAEATPTVAVDGRSLLPFARRPGKRSGRPIFIEANTVDDPSPGLPYAGIRTQRFKYVKYRTGEEELYDLKRDPHELRSRHRSRSYRRTLLALRQATQRYRNCAGASCRAALGSVSGPR